MDTHTQTDVQWQQLLLYTVTDVDDTGHVPVQEEKKKKNH